MWAIRCKDLYMKRLIERFADVPAECSRWTFALRSYNGGLGWMNRERKMCRETPGCDQDNPEHLLKFNAGRSPSNFVENIEYAPRIYRRATKYEGRNVCPVDLPRR